MKHLFIFLLLILQINLSIAQDSDNKEVASLSPSLVPQPAVKSFTYENPGITAIWRPDGTNYRANFIDPNTKLGRIIIYDRNGNVVRRENEVDNLTYPQSIGTYYRKNHPGEAYEVWTSDDKTTGQPMYYSNHNTGTIWFDNNGNVIPERRAEKAVRKK